MDGVLIFSKFSPCGRLDDVKCNQMLISYNADNNELLISSKFFYTTPSVTS